MLGGEDLGDPFMSGRPLDLGKTRVADSGSITEAYQLARIVVFELALRWARKERQPPVCDEQHVIMSNSGDNLCHRLDGKPSGYILRGKVKTRSLKTEGWRVGAAFELGGAPFGV
jgi:hypothetical protein